MYHLLKIIIELPQAQKQFSREELRAYCDLCNQSIKNNLTRLVRLGLLVKRDFRDAHGYKRTVYVINNDYQQVIKELYNEP